MKVLIVNDYKHEYGGAETYVFALIRLLESAGHEVLFVGDKPRLWHYASRVANPWYLLKFLGIILKHRPDVVHIHKYNLVYSFMPALAAKLLGKKALVTLHDVGLFCPDGLGLRPDGKPCELHLHAGCFNSRCYRSRTPFLNLQRRLNFVRNVLQVAVLRRTVSLFLCPSTHMVDWAGRAYGAKALAMPYFMAAPATLPAPPPSLQGRSLKLFFAGRLVNEKGLQLVLEAMAGLPVECTIAGDGSYRPALQALARKWKIEGQVHFLGKVANQAVPNLILESDACVIPSLWLENNPLFAYESMKCARALIGARVGGIPDLIEDGENGLLFQQGSAEDLRRVLVNMLRDNTCAALGLRGFAKLKRDYDPEDHVQRMVSLYGA